MSSTASSAARIPEHRVGMLALPDCQILDVVGPLEVFSHADRDQARRRLPGLRYRLSVIGLSAEPVITSQGTELKVDCSIAQAAPMDTLLVAGGRGPQKHEPDATLRAWLQEQSRRCQRFGSVCTGALLLARCGLLRDSQVTTHWAYCDSLQALDQQAQVLPDAIFTHDDKLYTSAGVSAGIDLALYLVEQDLGREAALKVARDLVVYMKRPGGQSQFSARLAIQISNSSRFRSLQEWLLEHLDHTISVAQMAARVHMSERAFARHFRAEFGIPPAHYLEQLRIDAARELLSDSPRSILDVALQTGFGNAERMRRAFHRNLGISATQYRNQFARGSRPQNT